MNDDTDRRARAQLLASLVQVKASFDHVVDVWDLREYYALTLPGNLETLSLNELQGLLRSATRLCAELRGLLPVHALPDQPGEWVSRRSG